MFLLSSDEDTLTGLRFAGVEGALVNTYEQFRQKALSVLESEDVGILFVGRELATLFPDVIPELRKVSRTLITEVPDMKNTDSQSDSVARYVKETVGIQLDLH